MTISRYQGALLVAAASLALAGCFGGGDDDDAAPVYSIDTATTPPDSAAASNAGLKDFILAMAAASLDGREPFDLTNYNPPAENADASEPASLPTLDQ